jgi:chorismate mutase / prephenate dehydratase
MSAQISDWRAAIDVNDRQLVQLLNTRAKLACELAKLKHEMGIEILDSEREQQVLALARQNSAGPLDHDAVTRIFQSIIEETRRVETDREEAE